MTEAQFRVTADSETPIVAASGDVDLANVAEFQAVLADAAAGAPVLTVDLTELRYCDSAAVRALFAVAATTAVTMVERENGPIKTLLTISGLDRVATVTTRD